MARQDLVGHQLDRLDATSPDHSSTAQIELRVNQSLTIEAHFRGHGCHTQHVVNGRDPRFVAGWWIVPSILLGGAVWTFILHLII